MKIKGFSATAFLILGIVFFILGLLSLIKEATFMSFLSQVLPNSQSIVLFGVITQFIGQALMITGVVKSTSHKFLDNMQVERQLTIAGFNQNLQQLQAKLQADKQALLVNYSQTNAKLDALIANQKAAVAPVRLQSITCKYCGAKTTQGSFCPQCGKAN